MARPLPVLATLLLLIFYPIPNANAQGAGTPAWIREQVARLTNSDVMVRKTAKDALLREAGRARPSSTYLKDLDAALIPLVKGRDVRARIIAGVLAEEVASKKPGPALEGVARALMESDSDATALIGTKVAKALLPATITLPTDPMPAAVVACVKTHPDSGEITEEAYAALTLQAARENQAGPPAGAIAAAVPAVLGLLETRIAAYGKVAPSNPAAEGGPTMLFLAIDGWQAVGTNGAMKDRILRDLGDLLCVQARAAADGNTDRALTETRRQTGQALGVTGGPGLQAAAENLMKPLDAVAPDEVDRRCAALDAAMPTGAKLTRAKR